MHWASELNQAILTYILPRLLNTASQRALDLPPVYRLRRLVAILYMRIVQRENLLQKGVHFFPLTFLRRFSTTMVEMNFRKTVSIKYASR